MELQLSQTKFNSDWPVQSAAVAIDRNNVHVWRAALDISDSRRERLLQVLSEDELVRAGRFYFQRDHDRFVVARGLLRTILGHYLSTDPVCLKFEYGSHGKPSLAHEWCAQRIRFNLSHSGGLALYAIALEREVGVDIEQVRPDFGGPEIAKRFFSPREVATLLALPEEIRLEGFFHCWTRKEAYIKARGEGLTVSLSDFDVSFAPGEPARLLYTKTGPQETCRWALRQIHIDEHDFVAALAVEGHNWRLACWQWADLHL